MREITRDGYTGHEHLDASPTRILGDRVNRYFGVAIAGPGDLDGDGLADVLVGASGARLGTSPRRSSASTGTPCATCCR